MFTYLYMKLLERRPASYRRRLELTSGGRTARERRALARALPEPVKVLEPGCGEGAFTTELLRAGCCVHAFDAQRSMVEAARSRLAALPDVEPERWTVRRGIVADLDELPEAAFGAVAAFLLVSELTFEERSWFLHQARARLVPGGRLLLGAEVIPESTGARLVQGILRFPLDLLSRLVTGDTTTPVPALEEEVREAGFEIEQAVRSHGGAFLRLVARFPGDFSRAG